MRVLLGSSFLKNIPQASIFHPVAVAKLLRRSRCVRRRFLPWPVGSNLVPPKALFSGVACRASGWLFCLSVCRRVITACSLAISLARSFPSAIMFGFVSGVVCLASANSNSSKFSSGVSILGHAVFERESTSISSSRVESVFGVKSVSLSGRVGSSVERFICSVLFEINLCDFLLAGGWSFSLGIGWGRSGFEVDVFVSLRSGLVCRVRIYFRRSPAA
ncbi:hypothetical protein MCOR02_012543 [Pyricularia oryzae]|nr:hypothetical protein MCOR02_012543 [Pyricularia oryzae]